MALDDAVPRLLKTSPAEHKQRRGCYTPKRPERLYLVRHGHKQWLDEDGHPRIAIEARMGHWLPGMEGIYGSVTVAMERAIMAARQLRWERLQQRLLQRRSVRAHCQVH
ncbi:hypothetical protein [Streptomyces sp. NPDC059009]|uniref:hypothetical protein n=1 Tax=Streptomyces sp. NPDC059009 TaxID=3346694 RepID=UPI00368EE9EB